MPDVVLILLNIVFIVLSIFTVAFFIFHPEEVDGVVILFAVGICTVTIGLSSCSYEYAQLDTPVDKIEIYKSRTIDDINCIIIDGTVYNLNERFKKIIPDGTKIKVTYYVCDGYWTDMHIYATPRDKDIFLEILDEKSTD